MSDSFFEGGDVFYKFCPFRDHGLNKEKHPTDMKNLCMKIREGRKRMAKTLVGRNKVSLPTYTCSSLWSGFDIIFLTGSIFIVEVAICLYVIFFFYLNLGIDCKKTDFVFPIKKCVVAGCF